MGNRIPGAWAALVLLSLLLALTACGGGDASDGSSDSSSDSSGEPADSLSVAQGDPENDSGEEAGDGDGEGDADGEEEEEDAVPVDVVVLGRGPIESLIKASATLEAESWIGVYAEAARRVREILVEEGDVVRRGQSLLRLQDAEQRSALARVQSQLDKAQREHDRQQRLFESELTTEKALNDAIYDLEQQKIAFTDAERELSYTHVRAPIPGTVTRRLVNVGDQVQVGQQLFDLVDFESMVARIYVPERNLRELHPGQSARIMARAVSEDAFLGRVDRVSPVIDPQSGTVKVTVAVGGQPGLRPGLYVDVELITATQEAALLVPKRALIYDNDQIFLYRLAGDRKVERLNVIPRLVSKDFIEPAGGLAEGDTLVVAGQAALKDGARVELVSERGRPASEDPTAVEAEASKTSTGGEDETSTEDSSRESDS